MPSRGELEVPPLIFKTAGLAAIAGLRAMAAPALLSRAMRRGDVTGLDDTLFAALGSPKVSAALQLLMLGEMIGDKVPFAPSRTSAPGLLGRVLSGTLVGATLFAASDRHPAFGVALGILSTLPAAYIGEKLRVEGAQRLKVPTPVLGLLEDGIVLFSGTRLLRRGTLEG